MFFDERLKMATDKASAKEKVKAAFQAQVVRYLVGPIKAARTDEEARACALTFFALAERHGWRFITRAEQEAASRPPRVLKRIDFQKDADGNPIGAVVSEVLESA
jgi:hypothetical protein